jgi:8-oxo-dGTP pyrophosphatase MutT (NUDIX family)
VSGTAPGSAWVAALHAGCTRAPLKARVPLWAGPWRIGSVEPEFLLRAALPASLAGEVRRGGEAGWQIDGELTASLHELAIALRDAGLAHAWRDEQLAVTNEHGTRVATVERAVVRPLGITTFAVHLAGFAPDGRHWIQQRSLTKANDPGFWDTMMGGMIPACDSLEQALRRETWEEAGLRLEQLAQLRHGGRFTMRRPSRDVCAGYVVEHVDWYRCLVPDGTQPVNQDGEVAQFKLMDAAEVAQRLELDQFTSEAAMTLLSAGL